MRFVGERKACAAIVLAFFGLLFLLNGLAGPPPLRAMFLALSSAYLTGFVGVVAGWFWARWYTLGLGFSGLLMAATLWWQVGLDPAVLLWGGTHLALTLALVGAGPSAAFDGRKDWRDRWRMDENASNRLGKAVMRAGASLPYLIVAGLAPRQGDLVSLAALVVAAAGLAGLARARTWGVLAVFTASILAFAGAGGGPAAVGAGVLAMPSGAGAVGGALLAAAFAAFAGPLVRALSAPPRR